MFPFILLLFLLTADVLGQISGSQPQPLNPKSLLVCLRSADWEALLSKSSAARLHPCPGDLPGGIQWVLRALSLQRAFAFGSKVYNATYIGLSAAPSSCVCLRHFPRHQWLEQVARYSESPQSRALVFRHSKCYRPGTFHCHSLIYPMC